MGKGRQEMRSKKMRSFVIGGIISIFLTMGFVLLAVPGLNKRVVKIQNIYPVNSLKFGRIINLSEKQDYVFKVKYEFKNTDTDVVMLNGEQLEVRISNKGKDIVTRYYYVPKNIIKEGENFLKIEFYPSNPPNIDLRIRNYIVSTAGGNIVIALKNSTVKKTGFVSILIIGIVFFIFSFGLWILYIYLGKLLKLSINQVLFNNILSFMFWSGLYFILGIVSIFTPYSLAMCPSYLFVLLFFVTLVSNLFLSLLAVYFSMQIDSVSLSKFEDKGHKIPMWLDKLFSWLKSKELSDKCVLFFIFLLIMCAFMLILEMEWLAEQFANIVYFTLVIGAVIKFIKFVRKEKSKK